MNNNLRLVVNNINEKKLEDKHFFEKDELKIILDLYAKMVSEGSWKDYGLTISSKQVEFSVFKNAAENAIYKICKKYKLFLIEDAAEAHGQIINKEKCGSFGDISTFSFHPVKIITTCEGGMCLTNDHKLSNLMTLLSRTLQKLPLSTTPPSAFVKGISSTLCIFIRLNSARSTPH